MGKRRKLKAAGDIPPAKSSTGRDGKSAALGEKSLRPGSEIYFIGRAWLEVLSGVLEVNGIGGDHINRQLLTADAQVCGPLRIRLPAGAESKSTFRFSNPDGASSSRAPGFQILPSNDTRVKQWHATSHWDQIAQGIVHESPCTPSQRPVYVVAGSKNLGKSTLARLLVNTLLNSHAEVGFLDCDLGQAEFTTPGMVSLSVLRESEAVLGPPYMHQRAPQRAYYLGEVSPEADPLRVIEAVQDLHQWWGDSGEGSPGRTRAEDGSAASPLVVNTHGWIQGVGLEVLKGMLQVLMPSDLICMTASNPRRNLPEELFWTAFQHATGQNIRRHTVAGLEPHGATPNSPASEGGGHPGVSEVKQWSAVDLRNLAWQDFASRCLEEPVPTSSDNFSMFSTIAVKLAEQRPYTCTFTDMKIEVIHAAVSADHLASVLNGAVVGLAERGSASGRAPCLGIGIVRGIDSDSGQIYLLTDVTMEVLDRVDVLQVGRLALPQALIEAQHIVSPYVSFWYISQSGSGAGVWKSRNTLKRASQN